MKSSDKNKIKNILLYYGYSKEEYVACRDDLNRLNITFIKPMALCVAIISLAAFFVSFFVDTFGAICFPYFLASTFSTAVYLLFLLNPSVGKGVTRVAAYSFIVLCLVVAAVIGLVYSYLEIDLLFMLCLVILPSLFTDVPVATVLLFSVAAGLFFIATGHVKTEITATSDRVDAVLLSITGNVIGYYISKAKIRYITVSRELKERLKEKDSKKSQMAQYLSSLAADVDSRSVYTEGHSKRVSNYAVQIGKRLGLSSKACAVLGMEAITADVGKIAIPKTVLDKNGPLTEEEYEIVKSHVLAGKTILPCSQELPAGGVSAAHHHERFDGTGYPDGLKGENIPLNSRIIAIADAYDAMQSRRPYREAADNRKILEELKRGRGTQFDPYILDVFLELLANGEI